MAPLAVDPTALNAAGASVVAVGDGLGSVTSTLTAALAGCAGMAGDDPAGSAFGRAYDRSAAKVLEAMAATRNGLCNLGDGVRMSAHNYSLADALSNVRTGGDPLPVPASTGSISAGSAPSAVGTATAAPPGWGWVVKYLGMVWPTGDSARLRVAATAWTTAATNFAVTEILGAAGPLGTIRGQQMPEGAAIDAAFTDAYRNTTALVQQCQTIAAQLSGYADRIDRVHAAILDLLARICNPLTGLKEVWDVLTRKDEDEIKKVAADIRTVIDNFTSEVDALRHQIASVLQEGETVITTMGGYAAKEWDQFLHGTEAGRAVNQVGQFGKGVGEELGGLLKDLWTCSTPRAVVDPDGWSASWKEMAEGMAPLVGLGGEHAPGVGQAWKGLGKEVTHWDEWSTNPAEAAGKSAFDVATLFVPGGAAKALGKVGEAGGAAARVGKAVEHPPRIEAPPVERPPAPAGKPALPPREPTSAPPAGQLPHGPTETKPPLAEKPVAGGAPKSPAPASGHPQTPAGPHELAGVGGHPPGPVPHAPQPASVSSTTPHPASAPSGGHPPSSGPRPLEPLPTRTAAEPTPPAMHAAPVPPASTPHGPIGDAPAAGGHPVEPRPPHEPGDSRGPDSHPPGEHPVVGDQSGGYSSDAPAVASGLNDAFINGQPTTDLAREVADLSTHRIGDEDRVVLGKWDGQDHGYIGEARQNGGIYFDTGDATWDAIRLGLGDAQERSLMWQVNEQFLRTQMENGVRRIEYVLPEEFDSVEQVAAVQRRSFSALEINFLKENAAAYGYRQHGTAWVYEGGN